MGLAAGRDAAEFVRALLDPASPPPAGLRAGRGGTAARRFVVYRNNVLVGLIDALEERFPVCLRLVGEEFFRAMAGCYVRISLPRSPILSEYGDDFATFIAGFEPARDLPYLPDVARLEYAIGRAYHTADARPLTLKDIERIPPDRLDGATVFLDPSMQLAPSAYPVVSIWRTNTFDAQVCGVDMRRAEDALIVRPHLDVEVYELPRGGCAFMQTLAAGGTLSEAAAAGLSVAPDFDLAANLGLLLSSRAIVAIETES